LRLLEWGRFSFCVGRAELAARGDRMTPAANRGKQLRRLSPVTVYAALSELPRGAQMNVEDAPD
jgi:hypothetical protein